jgi:hypothetical protein
MLLLWIPDFRPALPAGWASHSFIGPKGESPPVRCAFVVSGRDYCLFVSLNSEGIFVLDRSF